MKHLLLILTLSLSLVHAQTPAVYFDFLSHNEETGQWNNTSYYTLNRTRIASLAANFLAKGITWNMQSDWVFLRNVIEQETPGLMLSTGNKNVLRWMYEDKGVEMDPHAHESQYLYPDVAKLLDSLGLPESKVMGGTIYNDSNGINIWTNLVHGQYGRIFTGYFWKPDYMMGGGTPNHVADLKYFGFWKPKSPDAYLEHQPGSPLTHIGVGCELKVRDTSSVAGIVDVLKTLITQVKLGIYPADGIYLQTIFFEQGDLNNINFYNKLAEIADSANAIVGRGEAQWRTFKQVYTEWAQDRDSAEFQWACGQILTDIHNIRTETELSIYPNPATTVLYVINPGPSVRICDMLGRNVAERIPESLSGKMTFDLSGLSNGIYILHTGDSCKKFVKW